jgi:hypothetical protein
LRVGEIELDWLLKLRIAVARCGEMDVARWWNTDKQLGTSGASVLRRGFPRTHYFAQARSVIAVARHRCAQIFDSPSCVTLWGLTDAIEEEFDTQWEIWLDEASKWRPFFETVARVASVDLVSTLQQLDLVTVSEVSSLSELKGPAEVRAIQIPGLFGGERRVVALLALGFARGTLGEFAVPYTGRVDA